MRKGKSGDSRIVFKLLHTHPRCCLAIHSGSCVNDCSLSLIDRWYCPTTLACNENIKNKTETKDTKDTKDTV